MSGYGTHPTYYSTGNRGSVVGSRTAGPPSNDAS